MCESKFCYRITIKAMLEEFKKTLLFFELLKFLFTLHLNFMLICYCYSKRIFHINHIICIFLSFETIIASSFLPLHFVLYQNALIYLRRFALSDKAISCNNTNNSENISELKEYKFIKNNNMS